MSNPSGKEVGPELKACPLDVLAFYWAETLSAGEQSVLLTSSLRRLQDAINTRVPVASTAPAGVDDLVAMFTELYNCYTASKCAAAEKGEHEDYHHLKGMAEAYRDAATRCRIFPTRRRSDGTLAAAAPPAPKEEEAQGWRPIETAPKDKTVVIVGLLKDGRVWRVSEASFNGLGWYNIGGKACHWRTHWMPLPPAPLASDCDPDG